MPSVLSIGGFGELGVIVTFVTVVYYFCSVASPLQPSMNCFRGIAATI